MNIFDKRKALLQENKQILVESNDSSDHKATAYEARTAMHLHDMTAAKDNQDPVFRAAHEATIQKYHDKMSKITDSQREEVETNSKRSAENYLKSLQKHQKINPEDISQVHHTAKGIDAHLGKKVDQLMNPHDVLIKTKNGVQHGSSLKMTTKSQTVNNSTMASYDKLKQNSGLGGSSNEMWQNDRKERHGDINNTKLKAKLRDMRKSGSEDYKTEQDAHMETRKKIAKQQADHFNNGTHEQKLSFLQTIAKSSPDLDYDYTAGDKDYSAPISKHPPIVKINKAKELKAVHRGLSSYTVHDHDDNQLMSFDFRTNQGAWAGPVVTGAFGNLKPPTNRKSSQNKKQKETETPSAPSGTQYRESYDVIQRFFGKK